MVFDYKYWTRFLNIWYTVTVILEKVCNEVAFMLNEKRVKHMIRLASYDEKSATEDLKINSYFKKTYVRFNVLISLLWVSLGYIALAGIAFITCMETILENPTLSMLIMLGGSFVIGYFIILIIFGCIAGSFYKKKYATAKQNVKKYTRDLQILEKMYESEEA